MSGKNTEPKLSFEDLADRFTNEIRGGKSPRIGDYANQYPNHESSIVRLFPVLQMMEKRGTPVEDLSESGLLEAEQRAQAELDPSVRILGDYRIVREIGRGGMGIVFEAEQESLGRRVALKLLPDSARFDERRKLRFQQEAQASASLQHPNIVNVYGVGSQDDTSYFVMQYIEGQPLSSVLKEVSRIRSGGVDSTQAVINAEVATIATSLHGAIDTETDSKKEAARANGITAGSESGSQSGSLAAVSTSNSWWQNIAEIGAQTASALEHAHGNRILHRDIKPANLMIDPANNVWVTDFGLAKQFDSNDLTRTGEVVGTLRYMSPEQLNGNADERSDIFGLGLTLYEMAALQPAYAASDRNDLMKQALDANPPRLRSIDRKIPKDLETIIHKCIAAEPKRRYQTATDVKQDLHRLLSGEPVQARRISTLERMVKWCRRRPVVAALCSALMLSLVAGFAGVATQWRRTEAALKKANENLTEAKIQNARADQHFREARESVDKFYNIISEQRLLEEPGLQPLRKELMAEAATYYRNFSQQYANDESLKLDTGKALIRLMKIEGSYRTGPSIIETCDEAISIFSELIELNPNDKEATFGLAEAFGFKSGTLRRKDIEASMKSLNDSIEVLESATERFPDSAKALDKLAVHYQMLGLSYEAFDRSTGRTDRSLEKYNQAYTIRAQLMLDHPDKIEFAMHVADSCRDLGIAYRRKGENKKAIEFYDEAIEILEPVIAAHPENRDARRTLGSIANSIGFFYANVSSERDLDRAIGLYKLSESQYEMLSQLDPLVIEYQDGLGRAAINLGTIYQQQGKLRKSLESRQKGLRIRSRISDANPTAPHLLSNLGLTLNGVGAVLRDLNRLEESLEHHIKAREKHLAAMAIDPGNPRYKFRMIEGLIQLARVHCASRQFADATEFVDAIEQYTMPQDTITVAKAAKEHLLIACKIGKIDDGSRNDEEDKIYREAIIKSRRQFRKAADRGLDLLSWLEDDTDMIHFGTLQESIDLIDWVKAEFGE